MYFNSKLLIAFLIALIASSTFAFVNGPCTGHRGVCMNKYECNRFMNSGITVEGKCPSDPETIKCCVIKLNLYLSEGICLPVTECDFSVNQPLNGYCPGDSSVKLCVRRVDRTGRQDRNGCIVQSIGRMGMCRSVSDCRQMGGTSYAGFCSGSNDIQCCVTN